MDEVVGYLWPTAREEDRDGYPVIVPAMAVPTREELTSLMRCDSCRQLYVGDHECRRLS